MNLPFNRTAVSGWSVSRVSVRFVLQKLFIVFLLCTSATAGATFFAGKSSSHAQNRKELSALMEDVQAGINAQNVERLTALMADDVTVTWLNAEVSRGKNGVKDYYSRMVGGEGAILKKYTTKISLDGPARFYGDIAVAEGKAEDTFVPHAREPFHLNSRWSATLKKIDGQWKIVTLHLSSNVFTNPLMEQAQQSIWYAGAAGLATGAFLIFLLSYLYRCYKKQKKQAVS